MKEDVKETATIEREKLEQRESRTCRVCKGKIETGIFHTCGGPSLHAPWLEQCLANAQTPVLSELKRIRELLEKQGATPKAVTPANRRETR